MNLTAMTDACCDYFFTHVSAAYGLVFFFFGASVGSFLNVLIYRLPYNLSAIEPPSSCPKCGARIPFFLNIPILSWIALRGRCQGCRQPISVRYPLVELLTGLIWAAVAAANAENEFGHFENIGLMLIYLVFSAMLVTISFIDLDHQIIPDELSLGGLAAALGAATVIPSLHEDFKRLLSDYNPWTASLIGAVAGMLAGGGILVLAMLGGTFMLRRQIVVAKQRNPEISTAIGLGDVKLMGMVGAVLGWREAVATFFIGTLIGALVGVVDKLRSGVWPEAWLTVVVQSPEEAEKLDAHAPPGLIAGMVHRWHTGNGVVPYGPFLCAGALVALIIRYSVQNFFTRLAEGPQQIAEIWRIMGHL